MISKRTIKNNPDIAVYTKNFRQYLERAETIQKSAPGTPVTFKSSKKWASVSRILEYRESIVVYFAVSSEDELIRFQGRIRKVDIDPDLSNDNTIRLLAHQINNKEDKLWDGKVETLYMAVDIQAVENPFSRHLLERIDGGFLSKDYKYNYAIVKEYKPGTEVSSDVYSDERSTLDREYNEGHRIKVYVNKYERSKSAREACIREYGYTCAVCQMNFEDRYGELGKNFIHVHHRVPLTEVGKRYVVDPVNDLVPVCPNCHSMLHRGNQIDSIDWLRKLLGK